MGKTFHWATCSAWADLNPIVRTELKKEKKKKEKTYPLSKHLSWAGIKAWSTGAQCLDNDCCLNLNDLPILCDNPSKRGRLGAEI